MINRDLDIIDVLSRLLDSVDMIGGENSHIISKSQVHQVIVDKMVEIVNKKEDEK